MGTDRSLLSFIAIATLSLVLVGSLTTPGFAYIRPGVTELISVSSNEVQAMGNSATNRDPIAVSANGRFVVFSSLAIGLSPADANVTAPDLFMRDRSKGTTEILSLSPSGEPALGPPQALASLGSFAPSISDDGRFVSFSSDAVNLVPGDTNEAVDVFVHDRRSGVTSRVSISSSGEQGEPTSSSDFHTLSAMSGDGRSVAFHSTAPNLVERDTNGDCDAASLPAGGNMICGGVGRDTFVHDLRSHVTERVSIAADGTQQEGESSESPSLNKDGRFVAFLSDASNLGDRGPVPCRAHPQANPTVDGCTQVYVYDRHDRKVELASVASDETPSDNVLDLEGNDALSDDGRFVVFSGYAGNLVPNESNHGSPDQDVFVRDLVQDRTERVNLSSAGSEFDPPNCGGGAISGDGRFVAFTCRNPADPQLRQRGAVHDRQTGAFEVISVTPMGQEVADEGIYGDLTLNRDGRFVAFESTSEKLVTNDRNGSRDVFIRDRGLDLFSSTGVGTGGSEEEGLEGPIVCVNPDLCIPPNGIATAVDERNDVDHFWQSAGADLISASLVNRPYLGDLYAKIELEHMPQVTGLSSVTPFLTHGWRFGIDGKSYEVRIISVDRGTFELFQCAGTSCSKLRDLEGGYGTAGADIRLSIPLKSLGLKGGGSLSRVEAYSALGSGPAGPMTLIDRIELD